MSYLVTVVELSDGFLTPGLPPVKIDPPGEGYVLYHIEYTDGLLVCVWLK